MKIDYKKEQYFLSVLTVAAETGFHNQGEVSDIGLNVFAAQFKELSALLGSPVAASKLMSCLLESARPRSRSIVWLKNEMDYELLVARGGNREQIASRALNALPVNDTALDLYNERIRRTLPGKAEV